MMLYSHLNIRLPMKNMAAVVTASGSHTPPTVSHEKASMPLPSLGVFKPTSDVCFVVLLSLR